ncbi:MRPL6_1 [Sanghuangporus sanghuang]
MLTRIQRLPSALPRFFSTSTCRQGHVSRIGRTLIVVPPEAILIPSPSEITVKGPLSTTSVPLKPFVQLTFPESHTLSVAVEDPGVKEQQQM